MSLSNYPIGDPRPPSQYYPVSTPVPVPVWLEPTPTLNRIADILERIAAALEAER